MRGEDGRNRAVIEGVKPEIDGGRFAIKRTVGEAVGVEANVFTDGHDTVSCFLQYRPEGASSWCEVPMQPVGNDRWQGGFRVTEVGRYRYTLIAWVDHFESWRHDLAKRVQAEDIALQLQVGARLLAETAERAKEEDAKRLRTWAEILSGEGDLGKRLDTALDEEVALLMADYPDRRFATRYHRELEVVVDRERARFSAWYEMFPRSCSPESGQHGHFKACEARLPYIAAMGFDVLYLPPIHPIGRINRKGKNNTLIPNPEDLGSPWAIGAEEGGHKSIHPQLGTLEDFRHFVAKAREYGIEIALDIAFQCAPDHPYVKEHPEWFRWRPDNTVQYAENPPKKYEDIYPFHFETEQWQPLWDELKSAFLFWVEQGVHIFRVDNPHTKPFPLWEWLIAEVKKVQPDTLFLSEAFTRPKVMYRLAKLGFTQSYNYFPWRNTKWELTEYFTELTQTELREYFRPNLWPNTPDILTEYLQFGGRPAFMTRLVLAATLGANYGIYGPAYELMENTPREPGSEEYLNSEKYQLRHWDLDRSDSLKDFIARVNQIRKHHPALQSDWNLHFYPVDNEQLICYGKWTEDLADIILIVVNLDAYHTQSGWVQLPLESLGIEPDLPYQVHDLLSDTRYLWHGSRNYVKLNPEFIPAYIFRLRRRVRTERDFDYFM
ncbi:alpha-1,4-glucan--maltose-1-phosphate maltosyltransferase [Nitrosococcus wardiae]|uniref:Alpha-1,4-glucan:maltose-1-phosphate maltosyltransferase n=1 Tax=Nitrosococcus wardiae TaxID=1814290 RepID=A0A4P7C1P0_9GAMM|nr:alpha-1,4-glucan--maltose-1-phosphate maltosyltransferase [Nitrosococcus wardiae]QBQ54746.1 alpha-1,4-glucan--maltose-1-phosphate maltosyltransferase [Nitrosococcus wardiae]